MTAKRRVVRLGLWVHPVLDTMLKAADDVELTIVPANGNDDAVWQALSSAHAYQVSAAKDELPKRWFVTREMLERAPNLLLASSSGAGYDTIDVAACSAAGVAVVNQAGGNAVSVAEHTLALMLGVSRRMAESDRRMRREAGLAREDLMGHEIAGKRIGIVGIGHIGRRVAALSKAFGLDVVATDPLLSDEQIRARGAQPVSLDALLADSDFVSLHCPRDADTMRMIDAAAFAKMKPGAIFIQTARGGLHDEQALLEALQSGHLAGAGLDVWDIEPPPLDHPLLAMPNVYATFHTAGVTHEARKNIATLSAEQMLHVLRGGVPPRLINPEVWPRVAERYRAMFGSQETEH